MMNPLPLVLVLLNCTYRPFHSDALIDSSSRQCTWSCKQGFFLTPARNACRRCTTCPNTTQCTPTADTQCIQCPRTPGLAYTDPTCQTWACDPGWYRLNQTSCAPCPLGSYCTDQQLLSCPEGAVTRQAYADTPLLCTSPDTLDLQASWQILFTQQPTTDIQSLIYGQVSACAWTAIEATVGTLTCTVTVPKLELAAHIQHLASIREKLEQLLQVKVLQHSVVQQQQEALLLLLNVSAAAPRDQLFYEQPRLRGAAAAIVGVTATGAGLLVAAALMLSVLLVSRAAPPKATERPPE